MAGALSGLQALLDVGNLTFLLLGTLLGLALGVLPGFGSVQGIAILLPITYGMPAEAALVMLAGVLGASTYAGALTSILVNTPGDPTSAATTFDGYPLARRGEAGRAIGAATAASVVGVVGGVAVLAIAGPMLGILAVRVQSAEYFALAVLGLALTAAATRDSTYKGLVSACLGLVVSFVGFSPVLGEARFSFGVPTLEAGIDLAVLAIGMFAVSEALFLIRRGGRIAEAMHTHGGLNKGFVEAFRFPRTIGRSLLLGCGLGALPGVGGVAANFTAYALESRSGRGDIPFGKGRLEGVIAPEVSNNAVAATSLIPTLALGIPGSASAALMMGALMLHGVIPGGDVFQVHGEVLYGFYFAMLLGCVVFAGLGMGLAGQLTKLTRLPVELLAPMMIVLTGVAAYISRNNTTDVAIAFVAGLLAYLLRRFGYSLVPFLLGFVLGPLVESNFYQAWLARGRSMEFLLVRPYALAMLALAALIVVWGRRVRDA